MADELKRLQEELEQAQSVYSESKSEISSIEKSVRAIVQNMFKQSFGDPNAKDVYSQEITKTIKLVKQQISLEKELVDKQTEEQRIRLKAQKEEIDRIKKKIKVQEELEKAEEKRLNKTKSYIESINKLITGDLIGALSSLGGKWGMAISTGLNIVNAADKFGTQQYTLVGKLFGGIPKNANIAPIFGESGLGKFQNLNETTKADYANWLQANFEDKAIENDIESKKNIANLMSMRSAFTAGTFGRMSQGTIDELLANTIRRGQISKNLGGAGQLRDRLLATSAYSGVSEERLGRNLISLSDATAQYSTNIETVGGLLKKFGKEVDKGTISLSQLVAVQSGIAGASVQQNAGLGALLLQTGNLPADAMRYAGSPLGLSGWLRNNAFRGDILRGVERTVRGEATQMGLSTPLEMQEYFKMRYSSLGYNISNKQAEILGSGGTLSAKDWEKIQKDSLESQKRLEEDAKNYYSNTATAADMLTNIFNLLSTHWFFKGSEWLKSVMKDPKKWEILDPMKVAVATGQKAREKIEQTAKDIKDSVGNNSENTQEKIKDQLEQMAYALLQPAIEYVKENAKEIALEAIEKMGNRIATTGEN